MPREFRQTRKNVQDFCDRLSWHSPAAALVIFTTLLGVTPLNAQVRPIPRQITFPEIPPYFCSEYERRQWFLDNFATEWNEAAENAEDAAHYRAQVSQRANEHFQKGGDAAQQKKLDAEERSADDNYKQHTGVSDQTEAYRRRIFSTPVIDCSPRSLADHLNNLRSRVTKVDSQIKETKAKIGAIEEEIRNEVDKDGLLDAYDYGVLWGVEPATAEHHNLLLWVRQSQEHQLRLEREKDKLEKQKAALQDDVNRTSRFMDKDHKVGDPCPEGKKTAQVFLNATPSSQQTAMAGAKQSASATAETRFNLEGKIVGPVLGDSGGVAAVTYEPRLLSSLFADRSAPKLLTNVGGVWVNLDAAKTPDLANVDREHSFHFDGADLRISVGSGSRTLVGEDTIVSPSIFLLIPRVHVGADDPVATKFLVPTEERIKDYQASLETLRKEFMPKLTPTPKQVLLETTFPISVNSASQRLDWWPKNGLAETMQSLSTPVQSLDVSSNPVFLKSSIANVSAMFLDPGCKINSAFTEPNELRNVAPAPSLDPAYWPKAEPEPLRFSLGASE